MLQEADHAGLIDFCGMFLSAVDQPIRKLTRAQ
jgi:hypothetical protein